MKTKALRSLETLGTDYHLKQRQMEKGILNLR
jgi:hypothetical protein